MRSFKGMSESEKRLGNPPSMSVLGPCCSSWDSKSLRMKA